MKKKAWKTAEKYFLSCIDILKNSNVLEKRTILKRCFVGLLCLYLKSGDQIKAKELINKSSRLVNVADIMNELPKEILNLDENEKNGNYIFDVNIKKAVDDIKSENEKLQIYPKECRNDPKNIFEKNYNGLSAEKSVKMNEEKEIDQIYRNKDEFTIEAKNFEEEISKNDFEISNANVEKIHTKRSSMNLANGEMNESLFSVKEIVNYGEEENFFNLPTTKNGNCSPTNTSDNESTISSKKDKQKQMMKFKKNLIIR